jgi:poly [ADP-ribose] polymerase
MPPRRAASKAAPAALPLDGCSIATSGRFSGTTQAALQARITRLGATIDSTVTADTNFLIATEKDYQGESTKSKAATTHNVPVVTLDWLEETESSNAKADETKYLLSSSAAPAAATPTTAAAPAPTSAPGQTNGSKKRAASSDASPPATQDAAKSSKRKKIEDAKVGEGSVAKKSKTVAVSVDEYCPSSTYHVYIDDDGMIWDASLNQTNASANNNKFYKVQVCSVSVFMCEEQADKAQVIQSPNGKDFNTWSRWGRVGERGQMAMLGDGSLADALKNFEKKFKDKSGLKWEDRGLDPKNGKCQFSCLNFS